MNNEKPLWEKQINGIIKKKKSEGRLLHEKVDLFLGYLNQEGDEFMPSQNWQDFLNFFFMNLISERSIIGAIIESFKAGQTYEKYKIELESGEPVDKKKIARIDKINYLTDCIEKWMLANRDKGKIVEFFGSFAVMNPKKDFKVEDDRLLAYGTKEGVSISLGEMTKKIKKEKEEFINW